jgi:hypothetical protein
MGEPEMDRVSTFFGCIGCNGWSDPCYRRVTLHGRRVRVPCDGVRCRYNCTWNKKRKCYVRPPRFVMYDIEKQPTRACCNKFQAKCRAEVVDEAIRLDLADASWVRCFGCHQWIQQRWMRLGHVAPACEGGPFALDNIRPTCSDCEDSNGSELLWSGKFCGNCKENRDCSGAAGWS